MQQAEDGKKAMLDYEAEAAALRAQDRKIAGDAAGARCRRPARAGQEEASPAKKKAAKAAKAKPKPLSDWLERPERTDGRD